MKHKGKREEILNAALEIIAERGFHGSPVSMIAKQAGVASGTLYVYFKSKDELIRELNRDVEGILRQVLAKDYPVDGSIRERFFHIGTHLINYFLSHPLHFRFMQQFHNSPYGAAVRRERMYRLDSDDMVRELLQQGIARKAIKDMPMFVLVPVIFGSIVNVVRDHVYGLFELDDDLKNKVLEACWDSMKR